MKRPGEYASPLGPTMAQAVGFNDRRVQVDDRSGSPKQGTLVAKGHAKNPVADPSMGTANARTVSLESAGARFRVHPPHSAMNAPMAEATQANGRIVPPSAAVHYDKDWDESIDPIFDDAPTIADYPAGRQRLRGFTQRQG